MPCCLMSLFPSMPTPGMWPGPGSRAPVQTVAPPVSPWSPLRISKYSHWLENIVGQNLVCFWTIRVDPVKIIFERWDATYFDTPTFK